MSALAPIAAISAEQLSGLLLADEVAPQVARPAANPGQFGQLVTQGLAKVNEQLLASQMDLQQLATGEVQNLHQVMIRLEESRIAFQMMMQVRGRLLEAYQDIMKMQV